MASSYTSLLGLALPVTGELSGSWGDVVNDSITSLLDTAVAGTTTLSTDGDVTLSTTTGASNQARQAILLCSGARTALRTITAPAQSKIYTVINATTGGFSVKVVGAGPTTGVTIVAGESAVIAWNGSDFIKVSNTGGSASFTNVTVSGTTTLSGLTASTALALNSSKEVVSVTNTGTGNNVLSASPTLTGTVAGASLQLSTLTSGRVTYAGASGLLQDSANLTFNGTDLTVSGAVNAGTINATTLDLTNLEVTNIKAKDGTAGMQIADSTGVVSFTANPVMSGGTANGVAYLNGSKVLTTGSALTYNGTTFATSAIGSFTGGVGISGVGNPSSGQSVEITFGAAGFTGVGRVMSFDRTASVRVPLAFDGSYQQWLISNSEQMRLTSTGLGIGTSSPTNALSVSGNANITGNTTLGDASTDTVTVNGYMSTGGAVNASFAMYPRNTALTGTTQAGVYSAITGASDATSAIYGVAGDVRTAAAAFTVTNVSQFFAADATKGAGSTITNQHGVRIADQTQGTNNYGITSLVSSGTDKWNIYASGTAANYFAGNVGIGTSSPSENLDVSASINGGGPTINVSNTYYAASSTDEYAEFQAEFYQNDVAARRAAGYMRFGKSGDFSANASASSFLAFATRNAGTLAERLRIDSSGNLGLGVTPSAYGTRGFDVGAFVGLSQNSAGAAVFAFNNFQNSAGNYIYKTTNAAARYDCGAFGSAAHAWYTAPSGTAGNAISFTQAMTLDASGNLNIGVTSSQTGRVSVLASTSQPYASFDAPSAGYAYAALKYNGTAFGYFGQASAIVFGGANTDYGLQAVGNLLFASGGITERMRINSSGNVGIGTSSPTSGYKLDVNGSAYIQGDVVSSTSGTAGGAIKLAGANTASQLRFVINNASATYAGVGTDASGNIIFGRSTSVDGVTGLSTQATLTTTGNLGLGTSSPTTKAQITKAALTGFVSRTAATLTLENSGDTELYFASGNANIGQLRFGDDGGNFRGAISYDHLSDGFLFYTAGTERMRLDSSGNLGLGVTPSAWSSGKSFEIGNAGDGLAINYGLGLNLNRNAYFNSGYKYGTTDFASRYAQANGQHQWFTAPSGTAGNAITFTQAMTLDASGRLLVGLTSSNTALGGKLQVEGTTDAFSSLVRYSSSAGGAPVAYLARSKSATLGTNTIVASGDTLGSIAFSGANGTGYSDAAYIQAFVDGTPGASADMPGRLVFATSADGSATPAERMRIDSSGNLIQTVNTTAATLATNNTLTFSIVDNSTLRISVRGSDGTTRTATVALT